MSGVRAGREAQVLEDLRAAMEAADAQLAEAYQGDVKPDRDRPCICARLLPVGEPLRPCAEHGWMGEGVIAPDSGEGAR